MIKILTRGQQLAEKHMRGIAHGTRMAMAADIDTALAAAERRGATTRMSEVRYLVEYARAQAVGRGDRDIVEACDFVLNER